MTLTVLLIALKDFSDEIIQITWSSGSEDKPNASKLALHYQLHHNHQHQHSLVLLPQSLSFSEGFSAQDLYSYSLPSHFFSSRRLGSALLFFFVFPFYTFLGTRAWAEMGACAMARWAMPHWDWGVNIGEANELLGHNYNKGITSGANFIFLHK